MNSNDVIEPGLSVGDDIGEMGADSNRFGILDRLSSNGEAIEEPVNPGEILTRLEFNLTCCLEKLPNLNDLMMHVATRENEYESFASENDYISDDFSERAMEFDLFSGILDSEVNEMDDFMILIQSEIKNVLEMISCRTYSEESFAEIQDKLRTCEEYLKQSQDQISEIREQSARFQTTLSRFYDENWNDEKVPKVLDDGQVANSNAKIKMQTAEQQRDILRMLEKTMGREMDLENKLSESKQIEDELNLRLQSSERDLDSMEKEMEDLWERCFEADNASEVFGGVSLELLGHLQILQFNLKGSLQREGELRSKLENSTAKLKEKENNLDNVKSKVFASNEKISSLEKELALHLDEVMNLKKEKSISDSRSESAESKSKLLEDTNTKLNKELDRLKKDDRAAEKINVLEKELREFDMRLQQAVASSEASQEKQVLLNSTITDMENLIRDLKLKVSKEEIRADAAEERCIVVSEAHAELNEEISFLRGRLYCLEASLHEAEETKRATAKDIGFQTKIITDLVMRLAIERERLHKQISSLAMENKLLLVKLQLNNSHPPVMMGKNIGLKSKEFMSSKTDLASTPCENGEREKEPSPTDSEIQEIQETVETDTEAVGFESESETVRRIDAGALNLKQAILAMIIFLVSIAVYFLVQQDDKYKE